MELVELGDVELTYGSLESIDYEQGGQLYGTMDGRVEGERLRGVLRLTNLAPRRPEGVNVPTLRGVLATDDGAAIWVDRRRRPRAFDGRVALRDDASDARVTASCAPRSRSTTTSRL